MIENPIPRSKEDHNLWAHEIAMCDKWIPRIESEVRSYAKMAEDCKEYAPELVHGYLGWAVWTEKRAQKARAHRTQILDYLAGKIGPWW